MSKGMLIGGMAALAIFVALIFSACHFRHSVVSGVGAHFYLVDRWTGQTWCIHGVKKTEAIEQSATGHPQGATVAPNKNSQSHPLPLLRDSGVMAKMSRLELVEIITLIDLEMEKRNKADHYDLSDIPAPPLPRKP